MSYSVLVHTTETHVSTLGEIWEKQGIYNSWSPLEDQQRVTWNDVCYVTDKDHKHSILCA